MADLRGPRAALLVLGLLACGGPGASGTPADGVLPGPGERDLSPRELLGKRLFEDPFLSEPPGQACASCHRPDQAFTGNAGSSIAAVAVGSRPGVFGTRNPPTVMYASFSPPFGFLPEPGSDEPAPWGGEFLELTDTHCERRAWLRPFPLPGGDAAARFRPSRATPCRRRP